MMVVWTEITYKTNQFDKQKIASYCITIYILTAASRSYLLTCWPTSVLAAYPSLNKKTVNWTNTSLRVIPTMTFQSDKICGMYWITISTFLLAYLSTSFLASLLTSFLAFYVAYLLTRGWGPAENTGIHHLRLRRRGGGGGGGRTRGSWHKNLAALTWQAGKK